ncbi:Differentially expressed in FDCP 8 -like protein B [Halotydeus destructor]|nr:Differentially expressed in FDCP 8 -like protein B [Halotydeus destructor]
MNADYDSSSVVSEESNECSYLNISEDHFGEVTSKVVDVDENGLPNDKREIVNLIRKCMKLVRLRSNDDERNAELIVRLCELRIKLNKMNEEADLRIFYGHQFSDPVKKQSSQSPTCDICLKRQRISIIPTSLLKNFNFILTCENCDFNIHRQCMTDDCIPRRCPKELFSDRDDFVILDICPERGLSRQNFNCADCKDNITLTNCRQCDYDGSYYCFKCHWDDKRHVPARVLHNWAFDLKSVSRRSLQILSYAKRKPVLFNILELNTMLYGLVDELTMLKRMRLELSQMVQYIKLCSKTKPNFDIQSYLYEADQCDSYSFGDLTDISKLHLKLVEVHDELTSHITKKCETCRGKGFFCEMCKDKDDLLFPFSANIATCSQCATVFHKTCFHRKHKNCPKCMRIRQKQQAVEEDKVEPSSEQHTSGHPNED